MKGGDCVGEIIGVGGGGCIFLFIIGDDKFSGIFSVWGGNFLVKSGLLGIVYIEVGKIVFCDKKFILDNSGIYLVLLFLVFFK